MSETTVPGESADSPSTTSTAPPVTRPIGAKKKRRRRWPWILLASVVLVLVLAWLAVNSFAAYWIAHNGYIGQSEPATTDLGFPAQDVNLGKHFDAWYAAPSSGQPVAVIVHGYQANRAHVLATARALQARGYGVLLPDLEYVTGKVQFGGGDREANEVITAVNYAHSQSSDPVVLIGYSEGGAESVLAAKRGAKVDAVVTDSSPVSFLSIAAQRAGIPQGVFAFAYVAFPWFSGGAHLEDLSGQLPGGYSVPTLVIQGTKDKTVPYSDGPTLANLTHGTLWTVQGVGHDDAFAADPSTYLSKVTSFIEAAIATHG